MFEKEKFRKDVVYKRKKLGISICQSAKISGVNKSTMSRIENGSEFTVNMYSFDKVITWLGKSADEYFTPTTVLMNLPEEEKPIVFQDIDGNSYDGLYIKTDDMFFIGFEDNGNFKYSFEVTKWEYLEEPKKKSKKPKKDSEPIS